MDERYKNFENPPDWAKKSISAGALKGKTDINPQWRIDALTEAYGLCGIGWYAEKPETSTHECPDGTVSVEMVVALHVWDKDAQQWSAPIIGIGGDKVIKKDKTGIHLDEDAYKKCFADALGKAAAMLGIGASVYRGELGKYASEAAEMERQAPRAAAPGKPVTGANKREAVKKAFIRAGVPESKLDEAAYYMFSVKSFDGLTDGNINFLTDPKNFAQGLGILRKSGLIS